MDYSSEARDVPEWIPQAVRHYLRHTEQGVSIRALARQEACHPSTILRQIRRFEQRRDDPLIDSALAGLGQSHFSTAGQEGLVKGNTHMTAQFNSARDVCDEQTVDKEGRRILRHLTEANTVLAVAPELEKAAVMRNTADGRPRCVARVGRNVAEAFALKDWITCRQAGKVAAYSITKAGRAALRRMLENNCAQDPAPGFAEAPSLFSAQHSDMVSKEIEDDSGTKRRVRYNLGESPVMALSRRREKDGTPFLAADLVSAAERLREDFELAQMGPRVTQNWERFLTAGARSKMHDGGPGGGSESARERVATALRDLGPGLGDVALRCCCFLEGLEAAEKHMGWAARSGKVVLRIALQRLKRHYEETYGPGGGMIG